MLRAFASGFLVAIAPLVLSACADSFVTGQPQPSSTTLLRQYDKTLTKQQQQAVISELKSEGKATDGPAAKSPEN